MTHSCQINTAARLLASMFDALLPRHSANAGVMTLTIDYDDFKSDRLTARGLLHLACHASGSYVQVYAACTQQPPVGDYAQLPWKLICDHDSAWRDDGIEATVQLACEQIGKRAAELFGKPLHELHLHIGLDQLKFEPAVHVLGPVKPKGTPAIGAFFEQLQTVTL